MKSFYLDQTARHKYFLRLHYREVVRGMSSSRKRSGARALAERVGDLPEYRRARVLGIFLSLPHEIETSPLIRLCRRAGKTVAVPVVFPEERRMRFAVLPEGRTALVKNVYGISEPARPHWVGEVDLAIVPGSAFTSGGDRLGAGAGYYDRYLAGKPRPTSVGVCFDEQVSVRLPRASHDKRVDIVITPTRLFRIRHGY